MIAPGGSQKQKHRYDSDVIVQHISHFPVIYEAKLIIMLSFAKYLEVI